MIGTWAGATGIGAALGPVIGGLLLEHGGWRWIFAINIPLCLVVVLHEPATSPRRVTTSDTAASTWAGRSLGVVMLGATTYALTYRGSDALVAGLAALVTGIGFVLVERRPER